MIFKFEHRVSVKSKPNKKHRLNRLEVLLIVAILAMVGSDLNFNYFFHRQYEVPHYHINPDSTVTDTRNGLMWKRCAEGQTWDVDTCIGYKPMKNWLDTMPGGHQKAWPAFAGYSDWRMPTREELRTLVYCSDSYYEEDWDNSCSGKNYPNESYRFWSASDYPSAFIYAWYSSFCDEQAEECRHHGAPFRLVRIVQ